MPAASPLTVKAFELAEATVAVVQLPFELVLYWTLKPVLSLPWMVHDNATEEPLTEAVKPSAGDGNAAVFEHSATTNPLSEPNVKLVGLVRVSDALIGRLLVTDSPTGRLMVSSINKLLARTR